MQKQNSQSSVLTNNTLAQIDWLRLGQKLFHFIVNPVAEVFYGARSRRIPVGECVLWGDIIGTAILLHYDVSGFRKIGITRLYPVKWWTYDIYCLVCLTSGFWVWGFFETLLRQRLIQRLTEVFVASGLKNPLGKLPAFIFDRPIDEFTRKLRLARAGMSKEQFEKSKPALESNLQVYIDEFRENREGGSIDVIYSHSPMPAHTTIDNIASIAPLNFVVGKTRARQITASLQQVPHLMVAGQTGGGKSTFLRGLITTLYLNNPDFEFTLIDLKGGLEFQTFENLRRIKVIPSVTQAVTALKNLQDTLEARMTVLKANNCKDIDAYLVIPSKERKVVENVSIGEHFNRLVVVVDEAAEMFLAGSHASMQEIQDARRSLSQIARQGRSAGVHLVIATQRPDAKALDPQVKANLVGVLCFQMLNDSSSITVLGVGRATDLPAIPGRAIWKCGSEMTEVQTPYLGTEEADQVLVSFKPEKPAANGGAQ